MIDKKKSVSNRNLMNPLIIFSPKKRKKKKERKKNPIIIKCVTLMVVTLCQNYDVFILAISLFSFFIGILISFLTIWSVGLGLSFVIKMDLPFLIFLLWVFPCKIEMN